MSNAFIGCKKLTKPSMKQLGRSGLKKKPRKKADAEVRLKATVKRKAKAKVAKIKPSKVVSKSIVATVEAPKVAESTLHIVTKKPKDKVDEAPTKSTSHEATSKDATAVIVHTNTSGPNPINSAPLEVVTKAEVKEMIGLVMDYFTEKQRTENEEFIHNMQQTISTQFSSLGESLILDL